MDDLTLAAIVTSSIAIVLFCIFAIWWYRHGRHHTTTHRKPMYDYGEPQEDPIGYAIDNDVMDQNTIDAGPSLYEY